MSIRLLSLVAAVAVILAGNCLAQENEPSDDSSHEGPAEESGYIAPPPLGMVEPERGLAYRSLFRTSGSPFTNLREDFETTAHARTESVRGRLKLDLGHFNLGLPLLDRGFEPEDADLKLGPVYIDFRSLTAGVLFSDNIRRVEENRESGWIAIVRIGAAIKVQLSEAFHLTLAGYVGYLPLKGTGGLSGFGLGFGDNYAFLFEGAPALRGQIAYDTMIGGWPILFADDFRFGYARFSGAARDDFRLFDYEGFELDDVDRAGRYSFRVPGGTRGGRDREAVARARERDIAYLSNVVSATTERLVPGPARLRVRAFHENLWYNRDRRGLPRMRDSATAFLISERENMRFRPYARYTVTRVDRVPGVHHVFNLGVTAPLTDHLDFRGEGGYAIRTGGRKETLLGRLHLRHVAGPYTDQALRFGRTYTDFYEEIADYGAYHLRQVLGPNLIAAFFVTAARFEDQIADRDPREEIRTGLRFSYIAGPRTRVRLGGTYAHVDAGLDDGIYEMWTGRLELSHHFSHLWHTRLIYQYQQREGDRGTSYFENLVYLTITRFFR